MTIPNAPAPTAENASRLPAEEARILSELATNPNETDSYFAVSKRSSLLPNLDSASWRDSNVCVCRWYKSWQKYVDEPLGGGGAAAAPRPGPIDNSDIIETDGRSLAVKEKNYLLVNQQVWKTLVEW